MQKRTDKAIIQIFYYIGLVLVFEIENIFIPGKYNMHSPIDDMIPFVPIFVIPYFLWYLFLIGTGVYFLLKSREDLRKTFLSINLCMLTAIIIYALFPSYQLLRPAVYGGDIFSQWVRILQSFDSNTCVCPSLHVAVCISLYAGIINCGRFNNKPGIKIFALVLTIMICISTVFIKQHSVIDLAAGILLGIAAYIYVYRFKGK